MPRQPRPISREDVLEELRRLHRLLKRPVRQEELAPPIRRAVARFFASLAAARRLAGVPAPPLGPRRWTVKLLLNEIRRASRRGIRITYRDLAEAGRHDLLAAMPKYLGPIARARRMAGVPHPPRRWSEGEPWDTERVVEEILALEKKGNSLAHSKVEPKLIAAAGRYFGSWQAAIEASGFDYAKIRLVRQPWTRDEILALLRRLAERRPAMTLGELHERHGGAVCSVFGSLEQGIRAAKVGPWPIRLQNPLLTRRQIIARLRARRRAGMPTYASAVRRADARLERSAVLRYGSWDRALAAAGLRSDSPQRPYTVEMVVSGLRDRRRRRLPLTPSIVCREDSRLYYAALHHFGTWARAARRVGYVPRHRWSKGLVLSRLKRAAGRRGRVTTSSAPPALCAAAIKYFGTFVAAASAAGLKTGRPPKWTHERVIAAIQARSRAGRSLTVVGAPIPLQGAAKSLFGSWGQAVEAAGIDYATIRLTRGSYTEPELIALVRRLARERPTMTASELSYHLCGPQLRKLFGSVGKGLERAGLRDWPRRVARHVLTPDEVVDVIRRLHRAGTRVNDVSIRRADRHLWYSGSKAFGNWNAALTAAGLVSAAERKRAPASQNGGMKIR